MYEQQFRNELSKKADEWKVNNLQQELNTLKSQNVQLQREIGNCEGRINSQMRAIESLINFIIEENVLPAYENALRELKQYL
jgi:predicted  nucleic acid-binding Zn-ribbon protein